MDDTFNAAPSPMARPVSLQEVAVDAGSGAAVFPQHLDLIKSVKIRLSASIGRCQLTVGQLYALKEGGVVTLDSTPEEPVELYLDSQLVGHGELMVVGDQFAVRITRFAKLSG